MSNLSDSLTVALLIWATWAIRSPLLICPERSERSAHSRSFDVSEMSEWVHSKPWNFYHGLTAVSWAFSPLFWASKNSTFAPYMPVPSHLLHGYNVCVVNDYMDTTMTPSLQRTLAVNFEGLLLTIKEQPFKIKCMGELIYPIANRQYPQVIVSRVTVCTSISTGSQLQKKGDIYFRDLPNISN